MKSKVPNLVPILTFKVKMSVLMNVNFFFFVMGHRTENCIGFVSVALLTEL